MERYYGQIRDESKDDGVRLLTYYLSRHRRHLNEAMEGCSAEALNRMYSVRLKYQVRFEPAGNLHMMDVPVEEVNGHDLLEAAAQYDAQLIALYQDILRQPIGEEASGLLESLVRIEEKDIVMLKKMIAMKYF